MSRDAITAEDVRGRARVHTLLETDPRQALTVARSIAHPWYRCQSLSYVAEAWGTKKQKLQILDEAFASAALQPEVNRIVTVSSWPLQILVDLNVSLAMDRVQHLVQLACEESHTLRRAHALSAIAWSVRPNDDLLKEVLPSLVYALLNGRCWRIDRLIRSTVGLAIPSMPQYVDALVAHHSDGRKKRRLVESVPHGV